MPALTLGLLQLLPTTDGFGSSPTVREGDHVRAYLGLLQRLPTDGSFGDTIRTTQASRRRIGSGDLRGLQIRWACSKERVGRVRFPHASAKYSFCRARLECSELPQRIANLFVGRSLGGFRVDEAVGDQAFLVDHIGRRVGDTLLELSRIAYAVAVDNFVIPVFQKRKIGCTGILGYLDQRILRLVARVKADGENLHVPFFAWVEEGFQLPELEGAV